MKIIKFIDLFAGIGGFRFATNGVDSTLDFRCVFSSEWDRWARKTYTAWHGDIPHGDITGVNVNEIPRHDALFAGFPCQPFSHAGKRLGFDDTRGTLFFEVARIIDFHQPKYVLLENVKGFARHDGGRTLEIVKRVLSEAGYSVHFKVLNARDFGLPQNRQRIFIVGLRNEVNPFTFPEGDGKGRDSNPLGRILERGPHLREFQISSRLWEGHLRRKANHLEKGNGFGYQLFNRDSTYGSTLSARYYKDGSEFLIEMNKGRGRPRLLTLREGLRLQGFPVDELGLIFPVAKNHAYKQIGNSVPVPVVRELLRSMLGSGGDLQR